MKKTRFLFIALVITILTATVSPTIFAEESIEQDTQNNSNETKTEEIEDSDTHEMKTVSTEIGLGTYSSVIYEESDPVEYEKKCVELLKTYNL